MHEYGKFLVFMNSAILEYTWNFIQRTGIFISVMRVWAVADLCQRITTENFYLFVTQNTSQPI